MPRIRGKWVVLPTATVNACVIGVGVGTVDAGSAGADCRRQGGAHSAHMGREAWKCDRSLAECGVAKAVP